MNANHFFLLALTIPFFAACHHRETAVVPETPTLQLTDSLLQVISIDTVNLTPLNNELLLNGRVTFDAGQLAQVYPLYGGTILRVPAETGDYVQKGALLAEIRSTEVSEIEKQHQEAKHQLALANRNSEAVRDMYAVGMASERDLLQAEQEAAVAQAEQQRLEAVYSLHHLKENSTYQLTAPVSGFIIDKQISPNMQIRPDQADALFTISGLSDVWVMADVYESDIHKIRPGAPVRITTLAYGGAKNFEGNIDKIYNLLDPESKTMKVRIQLNNSDYLLKPGMFTNVYVDCGTDNQLMPCIPAGALIFDDGKDYVVTLDETGSFRIQPVEVYKRNGSYCYLASGLNAGRPVVEKNALLIFNALK